MRHKRVVLTYGTFDLLHYGHVLLLQRAKALGDYLIVGLSTDEFNKVTIVVKQRADGAIEVSRIPIPDMPAELKKIIEDQKQ